MKTDNSILFFTDFNCPFCYALNERLITLGDKSKIEWRGIEHDPAVSSKQASLADINKLVNQVNIIRTRAQEIAIVTPPFRPNTRLANRVIFLMSRQDKRKIAQCRTLIYRALWLDGQDISNRKILEEIVASVGLIFPSDHALNKEIKELQHWQNQWKGEQFKSRLPVLFSVSTNKPLLGFPTYELLHYFFNGIDLPVAPESLAACQLKPQQNMLVVGNVDTARCNLVELEAVYQIIYQPTIDEGRTWLKQQPCDPDLILLDHLTLQQHSIDFCSELKQGTNGKNYTIVFLLDKIDDNIEMQSFDVGASDVLYNLTNAKICQARFETLLRVKQSATLLEALARIDYLTQLSNRGEFDRKFEREWFNAVRANTPLSVALFDIDFFKRYNDHYGHQTGDECLRQVSRTMAKSVKRTTDFIARYGGEEFVVILPQTDQQGAFTIADAMRVAVENIKLPHKKSTVSATVTLSGGVATLLPCKDLQPNQLLALADEALYQSKAAGRNRITLHKSSVSTPK